LGNGENHGYKPLKYSTILKNNFKRDVFTREKNKGRIKLGVFFGDGGSPVERFLGKAWSFNLLSLYF
jgi:hypothetical protein